nr:hypothetical protein [Tanacetum cinerariifolium]
HGDVCLSWGRWGEFVGGRGSGGDGLESGGRGVVVLGGKNGVTDSARPGLLRASDKRFKSTSSSIDSSNYASSFGSSRGSSSIGSYSDAFASTSHNQKFTVVTANDVPLERETKEDIQGLLPKSRKLSSAKIISSLFLSRKMRLKPSGLLDDQSEVISTRLPIDKEEEYHASKMPLLQRPTAQ